MDAVCAMCIAEVRGCISMAYMHMRVARVGGEFDCTVSIAAATEQLGEIKVGLLGSLGCRLGGGERGSCFQPM